MTFDNDKDTTPGGIAKLSDSRVSALIAELSQEFSIPVRLFHFELQDDFKLLLLQLIDESGKFAIQSSTLDGIAEVLKSEMQSPPGVLTWVLVHRVRNEIVDSRIDG